MKAKVNGSWKDTNPYAKVGGAWKEGTYVFSKVGGAWKKVFQKYPEVSGGTLTSDATYYYRTFTANDTLTVTNGTLNFDYVVVGGGGGGGAPKTYTGYGGCYYQGTIQDCCADCGNCDGGWNIYCYVNYQSLYFCNGLTNYSCGLPSMALNFDGGGGGAGGVVTGSTSMSDGSTSIVIGNGGSGGIVGGAAPTNGGNSSAFGITAYGGGYGSGVHGAASNGASGGGSNGDHPGGSAIYGSQGNHGSHRRTTTGATNWSGFMYGGFTGNQYTAQQLIDSGYYRASTFGTRTLMQPGWGGGAGQSAHCSSTNDPRGDNLVWTGTAYSGQGQQEIAMNTEIATSTQLNDFKWAPLLSPNTPPIIINNDPLSYVETVGAVGQKFRMAVWTISYGQGVSALGLNVGGGGMGGYAARSLARSFGGGYPMNATTSQGTYSVNGTANTGGGGGGGMGGYTSNGGNGGSGVVRIRYLRSAVGG